MAEPAAPPVLCFGEVLWDCLPRGLFPGGAPINVAYHLQKLGLTAYPVTAVGADFLGHELIRRLEHWGLDTRFVNILPDKQTGVVRAHIQPDGSAKYEIVEDVAWDWIELQPAAMERAHDSAAVVFGSLAQRSEYNRQSLADLLDHCPSALKVFDVNLRTPDNSVERVWSLARCADLIKLNDHELSVLLNRAFPATELADAARQFAKRLGATRVCVTAGAKGAGLLLDDDWLWESARPVPVGDTVGAGDAFLAALLFGLLQRSKSPMEILRSACRLAEFVTTQDGATPAYNVDAHGNVTPRN